MIRFVLLQVALEEVENSILKGNSLSVSLKKNALFNISHDYCFKTFYYSICRCSYSCFTGSYVFAYVPVE